MLDQSYLFICKIKLKIFWILILTLVGCASYQLQKNIKLDHVYIVIDDTTYSSLQKSKILNLPGLFLADWNKSIDGGHAKWQATYLYGSKGFLELFSRKTQSGQSWMKSFGIGMITEKKNTIDSIHNLFPHSSKNKYELGKYEYFENLFGKTSFSWSGNGSYWVSEFYGEDVTREKALSDLRRKLNIEFIPAVDEISELRILLNTEELKNLDLFFTELGFRKSSQKVSSIMFEKDGLRIELGLSDKLECIEKIVFKGRFSSYKYSVEQIGNLKLVLDPELNELSILVI